MIHVVDSPLPESPPGTISGLFPWAMVAESRFCRTAFTCPCTPGMLNPDEEDDTAGRRQRRSLSIDGLGAATTSTQTQTARVIYTTASSTPGSASPVKITISKSPQGRTIVSQPGGQPPKVRSIFVVLLTSALCVSCLLKVLITVSISVYVTQVMLVQLFEPLGKFPLLLLFSEQKKSCLLYCLVRIAVVSLVLVRVLV